MYDESLDRQWPVCSSPWVMRMRWLDLAFLHWKVDLDALRPHIPATLEIDTFEGEAWIGVVPFRMSSVSARCLPDIPGLSAFPELNVRTYVTHNGKPGVWFFSLDATNRIAVRVARRTFHLNYLDARITLARQNESINYHSVRTHRDSSPATLDITYEPRGEPFRAPHDSLEYFLTSRYCLYSANSQGRVYRGEIDHPNWQLRPGTCHIRENSMTNGLGIELNAFPDHILMAEDILVRAWWPSVLL